MNLPVRITRGWWLLAGAVGLISGLRLGAQSVSVRLSGDSLRVAAPRLHFLEGKALQRLHDGNTVTFLIQLSLLTDSGVTVRARDIQRFALSYDLWEEKYSASRLGSRHSSVSHLAQTAVEAWCLDQLVASSSGLSPDKPFSVRLEVRAEDPKEPWSEPGLSFGRLIEIFSRPARGQQLRWMEEAGPFRLTDLKSGAGRGPGAG